MERTRDMINNLNFLSDDWDIYEDLNGYNIYNQYEDISVIVPRYKSNFMEIDVWCSGEHLGGFTNLFRLDKFMSSF